MPAGDFPVRPWLDDPDSGSPLANLSHEVADQTPVDAAGQRDQEERLSDYTDARVEEQAALDAAARGAHAARTTAVHGIPDTAALATLDDVDAAVGVEATARADAVTGEADTRATAVAALDGRVDALEAGTGGPATADADLIRKLARPRVSVGMGGHIGKQGFAIIPPGGKSMDWPLQVRADGSNLGFTWGAFMRAEGTQDPLPLSHYYLSASVITPITNSFATPATPIPHRLLIEGEVRKRVDPGALVDSDALGGFYRTGAWVMTRTFIVGEGVLGPLGAPINTTPATDTQEVITGPQLNFLHPLYGRSFFAQIDDEVVKVIGGTTGTAWTVRRGQYATVVAMHANGASVGHAVEAPADRPTSWESNAWSYDGDQTMTPAPVADGLAQHYISTPMVMWVERLAQPTKDCVVIVGDSRSQGQGDDIGTTADPRGFQERACVAAGLPFIKLAAGGTGLQTWTLSEYTLWKMAADYGGTIVSIALGTNAGNETAQTLFDQLNAVIDICVALGLKVVVNTIPPRTDPGNAPSIYEPNRQGYNNLIRANLLDDVRVWRAADGGGAVSADADNVPNPDGPFWGLDSVAGILGTDLHDSGAGHTLEGQVLGDALLFVAGGGKGGISTGTFTSSTVPAAPVNTSAPAITGSPVTGQTLNCSNGTWSGYPAPAFTRQWKRDGVNIAGATSSSYVLVTADEGHNVKCTVTATNSQGVASADSNVVVPAAVPAPTNTVAPAITGTATTGQVVTCSNGTWSGSPTGFTFQWKRNGVAIAGETNATYTLAIADEGAAVKCTVTATNAGGSTAADSNTINPTSGAVFDPATLNPAYFLDPTTLNSTLADGADVTQLVDISANARVLASGSATKPMLHKNVIDGQSVIDFDKVGQTDLHIDGPEIPQGFEVWTVYGLSDFPGDNSGGSRQIVWGGQGGAVPYMGLTPGGWDDALPYSISLYAGTVVQGDVAGSSRASGMAFRLQRAVLNGAASFVERNGVQVMAGDTGANQLLGLYLAHSGGFGGYANLRFARMIVFPFLLNAGQAANVMSYFRAKFPSLGL